MWKKIALTLGLVATIALPVGIARAMPRAQGGEGEVDIVAWAGYIERGESDKNYDWVTGFEKATGCKVNVQIADTSDEMFTLMSEGNYDLVTASGDASNRLIAAKRVQPVDLARVSNYQNVDKRLQGGAWYTVDGKSYGTPYQWGPNVLMYNTKVFPQAPTSWSVVFEEQKLPDGKSNTGRVQAYSGPIYMADAALYLATKQPDLKITDPYELDQKQYDAVLALLRGQRKIVSSYWQNASAQVDNFTNEGLAASSSWPFQVNTLQAATPAQPIASTIPQEGATGWADTTMLSATAPHPNCAYLWMQHSLEPKVQGDVAAWFGSVPAVPAACAASDLLGKDGCKTNGIDNFDKIKFWRTPNVDCGDTRGKTCIPYRKWVTDYIAIIGGQ
jgi:putative spermidine/putrescine transport system substrate-binding protein